MPIDRYIGVEGYESSCRWLIGPGTTAAAHGSDYRVEREPGRGGMATVYLADDLRHDRKVVVVVPPDLFVSAAGNQDFYDVAPGGRRFLMVRVTPGEGTRGLILVQNFVAELRRIAPN